MGFHLRKSFNLGALRFNLSNSGIGMSTGIKGLRFGVDGKGHGYFSGGKGIVRFRQYLKADNTPAKAEDLAYCLRESLPYMLKDNSLLTIFKVTLWLILFPIFFIGGVCGILFKEIVIGSVFICIFIALFYGIYLANIAKTRRYCLYAVKMLKNNDYDTALNALNYAKNICKNSYYKECIEDIINKLT